MSVGSNDAPGEAPDSAPKTGRDPNLTAELRVEPSEAAKEPANRTELGAAGFSDAVEIGRGGFGVVYRCRQQALGRAVAIKVLTGKLDQDSRDRFLREEQAMGKLSGHPNIVDVLQVGVTDGGTPYIVMPYHARGSLDGLIRESGPLAWPDAVRFGVKLAGAVETAHRAGVLHRDVKPANVLLTTYGEPQLTDFGVARVSGGFETSTDTIIGSPAFTAPEVLKGEPPTIASDVYGLGATLFTALTGHAAYERRSGEKVVTQFLRITSEPLPDLRHQGIPDDVAEVIEAAMSTDPADRPETAGALGELLRAVEAQHGLPIQDMALPSHDRGLPGTRDGGETSGPAGLSAPTPTGRRHTDRGAAAGYVTPPPTASTKYLPPVSNMAMLGRDRLIEKLSAGAGRKLTVIHGPVGSGKTALAARWRELLLEETRVAWMRVDEDDNTVAWFLAHVVEAIERARPGGGPYGIVPEEFRGDPEKYLLKTLVDDIVGCCDPTVVVLDDWHRVTSERTRRALDFLLDHGGSTLLLVVTCQGRAGLPLGRMRLRDELVEITGSDLQLDVDEAKELLNSCNKLDLSDVAVSMLHAAADGWLAGLQLSAQSMAEHQRRERAGPAEVIGGLAGRRTDEYLEENVLHDLEPKMAQFLTALCVVDRANGALAGALTRNAEAQAMLEQACERDLFVLRDDADPEWYRLHPMFAEFLRRRLQRENPRLERKLHLHASEWFAQHRMMDEAVEHAMAAADPARAEVAAAAFDDDTDSNTRLAALLSLVSRLPDTMVPRSKIMMAVAKTNLALRQSETARTATKRLERLWKRGV